MVKTERKDKKNRSIRISTITLIILTLLSLIVITNNTKAEDYNYSINHTNQTETNTEQTTIDSDHDGVIDQYDICPNTPREETIVDPKENYEYAGCTCEQIKQKINLTNPCIEFFCYGEILEIKEKTHYGELIYCPEDTCVGYDFYDFPPDGYNQCENGEPKKYSCEPRIEKKSLRCGYPETNQTNQTSQVNQTDQTNETINESISETTNETTNIEEQSQEMINESINETINETFNKTINETINWSNDHEINESMINEIINETINETINAEEEHNKTINRTDDVIINKTFNETINEKTEINPREKQLEGTIFSEDKELPFLEGETKRIRLSDILIIYQEPEEIKPGETIKSLVLMKAGEKREINIELKAGNETIPSKAECNDTKKETIYCFAKWTITDEIKEELRLNIHYKNREQEINQEIPLRTRIKEEKRPIMTKPNTVKEEQEIIKKLEIAEKKKIINKDQTKKLLKNTQKLRNKTTINKTIKYDEKENKSEIIITIKPKKGEIIRNLTIIEEIPKNIAENANELEFNIQPIILEEDPLIMWSFAKVDEELTLTYKVNKKITPETEPTKTVVLAEEIKEKTISWQIIIPILLFPIVLFFAIVIIKTSRTQ